MDGEREGEVEEEEEDEAFLVSWVDAREDEDCLWGVCSLSAGDGERGVGGSEEVREERDGMLDVELWEGVGTRRTGGDGWSEGDEGV